MYNLQFNQNMVLSTEIKSIHQDNFEIERYVDALSIPNGALKETISWMMRQTPKKNNHLNVLIIGQGAGRIELPFIEESSHHFNSVNATFIDFSKNSNKKFINSLESAGFQVLSETEGTWIRDNVTCTIIEDDFEDWEPFDAMNWDVVIAFFVINFFSDWILGLKKIIQLLNEGGALFISEDTFDLRFIDNTFSLDEFNSNLIAKDKLDSDRLLFNKFWRKYYDLRCNSGYVWGPVISPSNMSLVFDIFEHSFSLGYGSVLYHDSNWKTNKLSWDEWLELIEVRQVFNCLCVIPRDLRKLIATSLRDWLFDKLGANELKIKPEIKAGHKILCFNLPQDKDGYDDIINYIINSEYRSRLLYKISIRKPFQFHLANKETRIQENISRLIQTYNLFPVKRKMMFSVISWYLESLADPNVGGWSTQVPILLPDQFSDTKERFTNFLSYALYMCMTKNKEQIEDSPSFALISEVLLHFFPKKITISFKVSTSEKCLVTYHPDGNIRELEIHLCNEKVRRIRKDVEFLINQIQEKLNQKHKRLISDYFDFPHLNLVPIDYLLYISQLIWENFDLSISDLIKDIYDFSLELLPEVRQGLKRSFQDDVIKTNLEVIASSLSIMGYANSMIGTIKLNWSKASFVPASSIMHEDGWEIGLIGLVVYFNDENILYNKSLQEIMLINTNFFGLEDAVQQYVKLVGYESLKSATSAIMSRNMSHNIGSHALNKMIKELKSNQQTKKHQDFLGYIRSRMDFIAEVTTNWTGFSQEAVFLNKEFIEPFGEQSVLLDGLCTDDISELTHDNIKIHPIKNDIQIAVPNGALAAHAFYSIIENLLRNEAKNNIALIKRHLATDNKMNLYLNESDEGDRYRLRIWFDIPKKFKDVAALITTKIKPYVEEGIIDPAGAIQQKAWGFKEMVICAAYLQNIPLSQMIDQEFFKIDRERPVFKPLILNNKGEEANPTDESCYLGFQFYLLKPKSLLILSDRAQPTPELSQRSIFVTTTLDEIPHEILLVDTPKLLELERLREVNRGLVPLKRIAKSLDQVDLSDPAFVDNLQLEYMRETTLKTIERAQLIIRDGQASARKWRGEIADGLTIQTGEQDWLPQAQANPAAAYCFFDRHGAGYPDPQLSNVLFWEPYSEEDIIARLLHNPPAHATGAGMRLLEAALYRVVVLDERIYKSMYKDGDEVVWDYSSGTFKLRTILNRMGVFFPPEKEDGGGYLDDPHPEKLNGFLKRVIGEINPVFKLPALLVAHVGILEKMKLESDTKVSEWVKLQKENGFQRVVLVSGRGVTANIPYDTPYLSFSALDRFLTWQQTKSKYHLIRSLLSARGRKK